jgi:hypothetical protein
VLSNIKITYKHGKGMINAQDFQLHLLEEFEKLRAKQTKSKKGNTSSMVESKLLNSSHTTAQLMK